MNQDLFYDRVIIVTFSLSVAIQLFILTIKSQEFSRIMYIKTRRYSTKL